MIKASVPFFASFFQPLSPSTQVTMKIVLAVALSSLALSIGSQAVRAPVQLEELRRRALGAHTTNFAATARVDEAVVDAGLTDRDITASSKRSSTISFSNPAAQGTC